MHTASTHGGSTTNNECTLHLHGGSTTNNECTLHVHGGSPTNTEYVHCMYTVGPPPILNMHTASTHGGSTTNTECILHLHTVGPPPNWICTLHLHGGFTTAVNAHCIYTEWCTHTNSWIHQIFGATINILNLPTSVKDHTHILLPLNPNTKN